MSLSKITKKFTFLFINLREFELFSQGYDFLFEPLNFSLFQSSRVYFAGNLLFFLFVFQLINFFAKLLIFLSDFNVGLRVLIDFTAEFDDLVLESEDPYKFIGFNSLTVRVVLVGRKGKGIFLWLWFGLFFEKRLFLCLAFGDFIGLLIDLISEVLDLIVEMLALILVMC